MTGLLRPFLSTRLSRAGQVLHRQGTGSEVERQQLELAARTASHPNKIRAATIKPIPPLLSAIPGVLSSRLWALSKQPVSFQLTLHKIHCSRLSDDHSDPGARLDRRTAVAPIHSRACISLLPALSCRKILSRETPGSRVCRPFARHSSWQDKCVNL